MIDAMPQIPFEVYDHDYKKTVHVMAGCSLDPKTLVLYFDPSTAGIDSIVKVAVNKAFNMPGITKVSVCRKESL